MNKPRLVMIGNGMAGVRTLEELLKLAPDLYDITVFGAEPHPNYNRIMLSPVLAGEQAFEDIVLNDLEWYAGHGIRLLLNRTVVKIDRRRRLVIAEDGTEAGYDRLVIATGSSPFILPVPGNRLPGVIGYRDIADTRQMIDSARTRSHAVVIGGGLLGLEAANGLRQRGMEVTVVHISDWLLERQLDRTAGRLLQQALEARGIHFRLGTQTEELLDHGTGHVCAVQVRGGEVIPADLVVMAAGIRPNIALAERAGLQPCAWRLLDAPAKSGAKRWLALKRFDCTTQGRHHLHSASGLLHADYRLPSLDYSDLLKMSKQLCRAPAIGRLQFARAIFNLLLANHDDHGKNWAFLQDDRGDWQPAPFYDATFSPHPRGEHMTAFGGYGKAPPLKTMQQLAAHAGFPRWPEAQKIIQQIADTAATFGATALALGVKKSTVREVQQYLNHIWQENRQLLA